MFPSTEVMQTLRDIWSGFLRLSCGRDEPEELVKKEGHCLYRATLRHDTLIVTYGWKLDTAERETWFQAGP